MPCACGCAAAEVEVEVVFVLDALVMVLVLPPFIVDDDDDDDDDGVMISFLARKSAHTNRSKAVHWARSSSLRVARPVIRHTLSVSTTLQGQGQE